MSINHLYSSLQVKPTLLLLNDIWRLSATTWPLFLQCPIVPTSINKLTSVTLSPTISPNFQRTATTEFLDEGGSRLTITFLMLLVNGRSSKNSPAGLLASCYSHSSIPTFMNILNPLLWPLLKQFRHFSFSQHGQSLFPGFWKTPKKWVCTIFWAPCQGVAFHIRK